MSTITHAIGAQGAQLRNAIVRILRGAGEIFAMLEAAIRVSGAIERHQRPNPADLKVLGLKSLPPRLY